MQFLAWRQEQGSRRRRISESDGGSLLAVQYCALPRPFAGMRRKMSRSSWQRGVCSALVVSGRYARLCKRPGSISDLARFPLRTDSPATAVPGVRVLFPVGRVLLEIEPGAGIPDRWLGCPESDRPGLGPISYRRPLATLA